MSELDHQQEPEFDNNTRLLIYPVRVPIVEVEEGAMRCWDVERSHEVLSSLRYEVSKLSKLISFMERRSVSYEDEKQQKLYNTLSMEYERALEALTTLTCHIEAQELEFEIDS